MPYVPINQHVFCKNLNAYDLASIEYFHRRNVSNYSLKNLKLLYKFYHKQIEYSKDSNLKATWLKKGILLSEKRKN